MLLAEEGSATSSSRTTTTGGITTSIRLIWKETTYPDVLSIALGLSQSLCCLLTDTPNTVAHFDTRDDTISQELRQLLFGRHNLDVHDLKEGVEIIDLLDVLHLRGQSSSSSEWRGAVGVEELIAHFIQ